MNTEELMKMSAEKAINELTWESIEFLFRPSNQFELLLRHDFESMQQKAIEWIGDNSPSAMPHRFRGPYIQQLTRTIEIEMFYRELKRLHVEK